LFTSLPVSDFSEKILLSYRPKGLADQQITRFDPKF